MDPVPWPFRAYSLIRKVVITQNVTDYLVMVEAVCALLRPMATAIGSDHLGVQLLISNLILQFGHFTYKSLIFKYNLVWFERLPKLNLYVIVFFKVKGIIFKVHKGKPRHTY